MDDAGTHGEGLEPEDDQEAVATAAVEVADPIDEEAAPGWYTYFGGIRFYDGTDWAGEAHPPVQRINYWALTGVIAAGVTLGVVIAWFLVWAGAQASPDHIYLPVKFVVKELPQRLRELQQ
jgi:hypothetical protein